MNEDVKITFLSADGLWLTESRSAPLPEVIERPLLIGGIRRYRRVTPDTGLPQIGHPLRLYVEIEHESPVQRQT